MTTTLGPVIKELTKLEGYVEEIEQENKRLRTRIKEGNDEIQRLENSVKTLIRLHEHDVLERDKLYQELVQKVKSL